jgi:MOSC domain-containing protein YiiM
MKIIKQFWNTTFCGVYFKVIQSGKVTVGDVFVQIKSCSENPTIADLYLAKRVDTGA